MADLELSKRTLILAEVRSTVKDLLYYDRKEDEDLPRGVINEEVEAGRIKIKRIVREFKEALIEGLDEEWFRDGP